MTAFTARCTDAQRDNDDEGRREWAMLTSRQKTSVRMTFERVVPTVEALGRRHVAYGVRPEHYDAVGSALIWTLERCLGPSFTYEARCAWIETYLLIAATMQRTMPALAA